MVQRLIQAMFLAVILAMALSACGSDDANYDKTIEIGNNGGMDDRGNDAEAELCDFGSLADFFFFS